MCAFSSPASGHAPFRDPLDDQDGGGIPSELDEELDRASSSPPQSTFVPFQNEDLFDDQVFGKTFSYKNSVFYTKNFRFSAVLRLRARGRTAVLTEAAPAPTLTLPNANSTNEKRLFFQFAQ